MARNKLISLSRLWYTILVVLIHLILIYFGMKQCYIHDRLIWPKSSSSARIELFIEKLCLITSIIFLIIFIYPALFPIGNYANDNEQITLDQLKRPRKSFYSILWKHSFALSSSLHLIMSFLILISTVLLYAKQIMVGLKDSTQLWRTDFDLLFDWSSSRPTSIAKRFISITNYPNNDFYSRLSLLNFFFASFICILREPNVFWSISKLFSILYSSILALNVLQWCLMYGALQLLLKNVCFNSFESRPKLSYLLSNQPYTTFFLYLLLEFLVYISSIVFSYYAYHRFQNKHSDRCSNYCPSLIGIVLLLLYTACKMPLVHDIFLLYIQTRLRLLFVTFIFEILHVLLTLLIWIYLTTKLNWTIEIEEKSALKIFNDFSTPNPPFEQQSTAVSLPELNEKPYEKIRIFQSEIYYHNRPKNWSLPLNQHPTMMAAFDNDDDIITRSPSYPNTNTNNQEIQYRNAIRKSLSNLKTSEHQAKAVFLRSTTPPVPPVKKFTKEQVEAARLRAQQMIIQQQQQQRSLEYHPQRHSAALLISQV